MTERKAGRLIIEGTLEHAYRICMWSRLCFTCFTSIHTYELERTHDARDVAEELYEGAISFDWSLILHHKVPQFAYMQSVKLR